MDFCFALHFLSVIWVRIPYASYYDGIVIVYSFKQSKSLTQRLSYPQNTCWTSFHPPNLTSLRHFYRGNHMQPHAYENYRSGEIPTFVYYIYASIFLFFNCFAINMILQYRKVGKWRDYLYGEKVYILLRLLAKSALAWQVFAGTLRP